MRGVKMDDLDHSMHIAEHDWTSFYEETEECGLLQPLLACPDNWSLSDSEDSGNPAANSDEGESNAAGCCMEELQINQSGSGGEQDDLRTKAEEDSERQVVSDICFNYPAINTVGVHMRAAERIAEVTNVTTTLQTEQRNVRSPDGEATELKKGAGDVQTESDTSSIHEPDPLSYSQRELHVNEPHTTDRAVSSVASRTEKERWFVTVSDGPARQGSRVTSVKKKRRPKEPCKNNHMCPGQEKPRDSGLELEINDESDGGRNTDYVTQSNQNSGGYPSSEDIPESILMGVISDLSQMSGQEDNLSEKLVTIDGNKHDPSSSASTPHDTLTAKSPSGLESEESDELGDRLEFLSTHSCDSDSDQSAEEPQQLLMAKQQLQSSSSLTKNTRLSSLSENTDDTQDKGMHSCHNTLSCNVTAANCEGCESTDVKLTFPSAAQSVNKMPDDNSTCDNTHCAQLCMPSETPGLQKHEINLSASVCSSDQLSLPPVPDLTLTPCSVADSPETYAVAAGHTRPVYAISAFWDEMEKLTINDILQLGTGRSTPPRDTQKTVTPYVDDFPTNHSSVVDPAEYNLSDGGLMDTSDTADSDYFTQLDESKPDRSSCEFSTSDFEEDYWQFLGTSRNPSPEPQSTNQPRTSDSSFPAHGEEESTASEGKETPVPSDDFAGECFEDRDSTAFTSSNLVLPRQIKKSKSVCNVQALNTEDLSLLGNDESSPFLSSYSSLEENVLLKASDSLGTQIPAPFLSNTYTLDERTQISFPEVFEYFFTKDKAKRDSRSVIVYDPEDISVAPVLDYTLCTLKDETSFSFLRYSQCSEEKPIPIFSYSHPTIRELTFPNYVFLSADCEEEDGISPVRVVSRSFMQGSDCGMSAAAPRGFHSWKRLLSIRKISFHDKGSIWCRGSGAWVFPVEAEKVTIKRADPSITVVTEGRIELAVQQRILENIQITSKSELSYVLDWMHNIHIHPNKTTPE